jgi:ketosteroid isomerase-like protein
MNVRLVTHCGDGWRRANLGDNRRVEASDAGRANVDLVRRAFDAWNDNDWEELGRIYHPQIEAIPPPGLPEGGVLRGWEALRKRYKDLKAEWDPERIEVVTIDARGDQVAARVVWKGIGRQSEIPISLEVTTIATVEAGIITRLAYHWDHESALESMRAFEAERSTPAAAAENATPTERG